MSDKAFAVALVLDLPLDHKIILAVIALCADEDGLFDLEDLEPVTANPWLRCAFDADVVGLEKLALMFCAYRMPATSRSPLSFADSDIPLLARVCSVSDAEAGSVISRLRAVKLIAALH